MSVHGKRSFFNENWQELESKTSEQTTYFVWGTRYIDDLILREKEQEKLYALHDPNWNVVAITNATGVVLERMKYDGFGKVTWMNASFGTLSASAYAWNRTFTGQVLDSETGLMLYRNRYYNTGLGRFVTRDPIGYEAGDNSLYRYVGNMPIMRLDPHGNIECPKHCTPSCKSGSTCLPDPPIKPPPRWLSVINRILGFGQNVANTTADTLGCGECNTDAAACDRCCTEVFGEGTTKENNCKTAQCTNRYGPGKI